MVTSRVNFEIEAVVSGHGVKSDYGVTGSPVWIEYEDLELDSLYMFGREWIEKELRVAFGDMGADALIGLIFEKAEEWEDV